MLLRGYGPEIYGFLCAVDQSGAEDAFSLFAEAVLTSLPAFRREAAFRTWAYSVARHCAQQVRRTDSRRRRHLMEGTRADSAISKIAAHVRTATALEQRTDAKDRVRALRAALSSEEQELLTLRIDRGFDWRDVARVVGGDDDVEHRAVALRKQFARVKTKLRALAATTP